MTYKIVDITLLCLALSLRIRICVQETIQNSTAGTLSNSQAYVGGVRKETTPDIIASNGYPVEVYSVKTEDGYVLELHRIPYGKTSGRSKISRPVVYLQHCVLCSSSDWVINTPDKALGYILADAGYDVWMGNSRGNTYSRKHEELSPSDKEFWNFSWDEIAHYDVPASIDFVLKETRSSKLSYIGFSMGTIVFFAMMSERPEYNDKVNVMIALGPVAYLENMAGPLSLLTRFSGPVKTFADFVGIHEVMAGGILMDLLSSILCDPTITTVAPICDNLLLNMIGLETNLMNKRILPKMLSQTPAGTSLKTMIHFAQAKNSGRFQKYSYGPSENKKIYKSKYPPSYDLTKTTVPVALIYAGNDWFANPKDVANLRKMLPNVIFYNQVNDTTFSHIDFLWSDSAVQLVYNDVLKILANGQLK